MIQAGHLLLELSYLALRRLALALDCAQRATKRLTFRFKLSAHGDDPDDVADPEKFSVRQGIIRWQVNTNKETGAATMDEEPKEIKYKSVSMKFHSCQLAKDEK